MEECAFENSIFVFQILKVPNLGQIAGIQKVCLELNRNMTTIPFTRSTRENQYYSCFKIY